jgi:hypothetical protein
MEPPIVSEEVYSRRWQKWAKVVKFSGVAFSAAHIWCLVGLFVDDAGARETKPTIGDVLMCGGTACDNKATGGCNR